MTHIIQFADSGVTSILGPNLTEHTIRQMAGPARAVDTPLEPAAVSGAA
jgi:hypothetical protein